ncbi:hypothetical protein PN462_21120 [Spirulina sp. CS-785/01]|uniref:hypothetical protein n=1 Tax=Spirulina sp. CS-785/01 TaxID=3021716 RepID=UPI00232C0A2C|nr:hypothetical protein [Spirulina sp. CS-785/01]MDB9315628.1 hypothetical protein [Spirulina sp. CS-785/01]
MNKVEKKINRIIQQQNKTLVQILNFQETDRGDEYEIVYLDGDKTTKVGILIQHFGGRTGVNWIWEEDFEEFLQECQEIRLTIQKFKEQLQRLKDPSIAVDDKELSAILASMCIYHSEKLVIKILKHEFMP